MCVLTWRPLMASECSADGLIPFGPMRKTAPLAKSDPELSSACTNSSYALAGSMSSPSTKARNSPRARSTPRLRAPPGPPCSGLISVNLGSAAAFARAISALPSVDPSATMITSVSVNVWAAIESRQSARSSSLLKNATTTLILGLVTRVLVSYAKSRYAKNPLRLMPVLPAPIARAGPEGLHSRPVLHNAPGGSSSDGRGFPAEGHRVVHAFHVDLVPQREYDQQPYLPPGHRGVTGPEPAHDVEHGALVQPLTSLRRPDNLLRETIHAAAEPVPERDRETELGPFRRSLR